MKFRARFMLQSCDISLTITICHGPLVHDIAVYPALFLILNPFLLRYCPKISFPSWAAQHEMTLTPAKVHKSYHYLSFTTNAVSSGIVGPLQYIIDELVNINT